MSSHKQDLDLPISRFMTVAPHAIAPQESLATARERLREHHIRHLPVRVGGRVIGLLAERDLDMLIGPGRLDPNGTTVEDIMTPDPYCVAPEADVCVVATEMGQRRIGSALIVDAAGHLKGIFTDTDALRALATLAQSRSEGHHA